MNARTFETANAGVPMWETSGSDEVDTPSRKVGTSLWKKRVRSEDLFDLYLRNPLAQAVVDMPAEEMFDRWFEVTEPVGAALRIEEFDEEFQTKNNVTLARRYNGIYGYAVMLVDLSGAGGRNFVPARRGERLLKMLPISSGNNLVSRPKIFQDEDPRSDTYGEIQKYEFQFMVQGRTVQQTFHSSRARHVAVKTLNNDPFGIPDLQALYNYLVSWDTTMWSSGEIVAKNARAYNVATPPKDASSTEIASGKKHLKDPRQGETVIAPPGWEFKEMGGAALTLNPIQFAQVFIEAVSAGSGIPRPVLMGTEAGAVVGAETNLQRYHRVLRAEQADYWTPWLKRFYGHMEELGILNVDASKLKLKWRPLFELTAEQEARTWQAKADAISRIKQAGGFPVTDEQLNILRVEMPNPTELRAQLAVRAAAPPAPVPGEITAGLNLPAPPGSAAAGGAPVPRGEQPAGGNIPEQLRRREQRA